MSWGASRAARSAPDEREQENEKMNTIAKEAIARSISHNEIVHVDLTATPYDSAITTDLLVACDDWADASPEVTEYWGTSESGAEWRVHVRIFSDETLREECGR
jgi:hypothetical protein